MEGEDGTTRAHDKAAVLSVFVIAARTVSLIFVTAAATVLFAERVAMHELFEVLADENKMPYSTEVRFEVSDRLAIAGDVEGQLVERAAVSGGRGTTRIFGAVSFVQAL